MSDKFQILRDFANSNDKPDKTIYQFIKEVLDINSAYAKELDQYKNNWEELKEDIPCLLEIIKRNEENIKVYQDEWTAIRSLENRMKELEEDK